MKNPNICDICSGELLEQYWSFCEICARELEPTPNFCSQVCFLSHSEALHQSIDIV